MSKLMLRRDNRVVKLRIFLKRLRSSPKKGRICRNLALKSRGCYVQQERFLKEGQHVKFRPNQLFKWLREREVGLL